MIQKYFLGLLASGLLIFASAAAAAPIVGDITFGGSVQFDTGNVNTANAVTNWFNTHVESSDGDFSSVAVNTPAAFATPWIFNPSTPTPGFWSVGGFTFDLFTSTIIFQGNGFLNIRGTGTVSSTNPGFDPTVGSWSFSAQSPSAGGRFSFSGASEVPEPTSTGAFLVGTAILAGGAMARAHKRGSQARRSASIS